MPEFEIHYRFEEDGRVRLTAASEDAAREAFEKLAISDIRFKGQIDFEDIVVRSIDNLEGEAS